MQIDEEMFKLIARAGIVLGQANPNENVDKLLNILWNMQIMAIQGQKELNK